MASTPSTIKEWDRLDEMHYRVSDLEEVIDLLNLEIDRLKKGLPERIPANISKLEQMAER